jgi:hypothetical protein
MIHGPLSTKGQIELAAAKRRIRQLDTELAVSRKVSEVFREQNLPPGPLPGDRVPDRAAVQRSDGLLDVGCRSVGLRRLGGATAVHQDAPAHVARWLRSHRCTKSSVARSAVTAELRYGCWIHVGKGPGVQLLGIYGLPNRRLPGGARVGVSGSLDLARRRLRADGPASTIGAASVWGAA